MLKKRKYFKNAIQELNNVLNFLMINVPKAIEIIDVFRSSLFKFIL